MPIHLMLACYSFFFFVVYITQIGITRYFVPAMFKTRASARGEEEGREWERVRERECVRE